MNNVVTYLRYTVLTILFLGVGFLFREPLEARWRLLTAEFFPCENPMTYSIGTFDTRFGISKEDFLKAVQTAEAIWEKPINKELFSYAPDGYLKINLIYDYRQSATQTLQKLGLTVDQSKSSYDALKRKYELMTAQFEIDKNALMVRIAAFEERKKIYEDEVRRANRQRNISQEKYDALRAEGDALEREALTLGEMQVHAQKEVEDINVLAGVLNDLVKTLNLNVVRYNEIGGSLGGELTQGLYESNRESEGISIFQYDSREKLIRVLAHELGHAISLDHLDDPDAIMYRLNQGSNDTVTQSDLIALKARCGIK